MNENLSGDARRKPAERRAPLELLVSVVVIVATLLLILNGTNFLASAERWAGDSAKLNLIMVMLNVALIIAGLRRLSEIQNDNERRLDAERRAAELASSDIVTRLANRKGLADRGQELRATLIATGQWMAVVSLQLHRFKSINDRHGYETGDALLRLIAAAVREIAPKDAIAARINGDEFALAFAIAPGAAGECEKVAAEVLRRVTAPFDLAGKMLQVGAYAGIATGDAADSPLPDLLRRADIALERARSGRSARPVSFDEGMERALIAHVEIEQGIRYAIEHQQFVPFFEPQVDLATGTIHGFEVLARWNHPLTGLIMPEVFIPVAEEHGLISAMSEQVIAQALQAAVKWDPKLTISVNISPSQLADPWLAQRLIRLLSEAGFPPERLIVEITESSLLADLELARAITASLKNQGIRLALDDFGTGFSSLAHLRSLPFDMIKIDRSFTAAVTTNAECAAIVRAVTDLAQAIKVPVIVEGIEDAPTHAAVLGYGCAFGQGWYFGKPTNAAQAEQLIGRGAAPAIEAPARARRAS
ncbi:putative bifunctional diguanylate cyclase/phosphodiesterase [Sphingomonas mesophila]|uniref:putative bifunctional diguanylate cyclase/phosphodiesterase n=1 Tax=Sphingomonas mesophila TaxID=2303576 RepID=UPI000E5927BF|nr:GGDEF domain-containing phosphodiesterase [Sphingomonas mesophila]